jgi:hypothetical protein
VYCSDVVVMVTIMRARLSKVVTRVVVYHPLTQKGHIVMYVEPATFAVLSNLYVTTHVHAT